MSDLNQLVKLLNNFDVPFKIYKGGDGTSSVYIGDDCDEHGAFGNNGEDHYKVKGYSGFYTKFHFDEDGVFVYVGAWE